MECTCKKQEACSACNQPSLLEQQEKVVRQLQGLILKFGGQPSGQLKDMAVALGVVVDKYIALKPPRSNPLGQAFYHQQSAQGKAPRIGS